MPLAGWREAQGITLLDHKPTLHQEGHERQYGPDVATVFHAELDSIQVALAVEPNIETVVAKRRAVPAHMPSKIQRGVV